MAESGRVSQTVVQATTHLILLQVLVFLACAFADAFIYANRLFAYVGALVWLVAALINIAAWVARRGGLDWAPSATTIGQSISAMLFGYVGVYELRTPDVDWAVLMVVSLLLAASILAAISAGRALQWKMSRYWKRVAALFPLVGLFQLWLTTDYTPATSTPVVNITTDISEVSRDSDGYDLLATVTMTNVGPVKVTLTGTSMLVTSFADRVDIDGVTSNEDLARAMDWVTTGHDTYPPENRPASGYPVLLFDELVDPGWSLFPEESTTRRALFHVKARSHRNVRLTASVVAANNRQLGPNQTCDKLVDETNPKFENSVDGGIDTNGGGRATCVERELQPGSALQALLFDQPVLRNYLVLSDPRHTDLEVPYLATEYGTSDAYANYDYETVSEQNLALSQVWPTAFTSQTTEHRISK